MKPSEFFKTFVDSHDIYDDTKMRELYKKETGRDASWGSFSRSETEDWINRRGKGGTLKEDNVQLCYGYLMAESEARTLAPDFESWQSGLGFRFRTAIGALEKAGY